MQDSPISDRKGKIWPSNSLKKCLKCGFSRGAFTESWCERKYCPEQVFEKQGDKHWDRALVEHIMLICDRCQYVHKEACQDSEYEFEDPILAENQKMRAFIRKWTRSPIDDIWKGRPVMDRDAYEIPGVVFAFIRNEARGFLEQGNTPPSPPRHGKSDISP